MRFLPRDAMQSADYSVAECPSIRLSAHPSHVGILSKRLNISNFYTIHGYKKATEAPF